MRDLSRQADFVQDAAAGPAGRGTNELQGDRRADDQIVGAPDLAHSALAEARNHPISAGEHLAGRKSCRDRLLVPFRLAAFPLLLMKGQERLHFPSEVRIGPAGLYHKRLPPGSGDAQRLQKHVFRATE